jgi:hypothetical protein
MDSHGPAQETYAIAEVHITAILSFVAVHGVKAIPELPGIGDVVITQVVSRGDPACCGVGATTGCARREKRQSAAPAAIARE